MRRVQTDAERKLWAVVRNRAHGGHKFKRQVLIGRYIADFACIERKLVIELDGGQHADRAYYDRERDAVISARGFRVLRFWNQDVLMDMDAVLDGIVLALDSPSP